MRADFAINLRRPGTSDLLAFGGTVRRDAVGRGRAARPGRGVHLLAGQALYPQILRERRGLLVGDLGRGRRGGGPAGDRRRTGLKALPGRSAKRARYRSPCMTTSICAKEGERG